VWNGPIAKFAFAGDNAEAVRPNKLQSTVHACHRNGRSSVGCLGDGRIVMRFRWVTSQRHMGAWVTGTDGSSRWPCDDPFVISKLSESSNPA
jgi:hypothetical protein